MKITKIETFTYWIEWCNWLFVKVSTDEGLYGWGEGSLHGAIQSVEAAIRELEPVLIGQDPSGVERHWQAMYHAWRWRGGASMSTALAALDIALWDLEGKRLGVPVYRLLGGPFRTKLRAYASHWMTGVTSPEQAYEQAKEAVRRGFTGFKWMPFTFQMLRDNEHSAIAHAAELMKAAREGAGPDVDIFVECGERLSPRTAVMLANALLPYRPSWFEEPIPFENARAMVQLQKELPVPIATGERLLSRWEYRELLETGGCKVIQPDLMHAHGITEVRKIAAMADTYYIPVAPHNPGGPICTLAAMHLSAAIPNFFILEQMEDERALRDDLCTVPVKCVDGYFELPTGPGLGTDLNLDVLKERSYRPQPVSGSTESLWR
ncbi:MAG: Galactonate dehydratase [Firmicutes bacterium]|nr:Galactonate dehydratase [Bacillota bacterium]